MSELRVSDADRDLVAERLRAAAGEGRLSADEPEERLESAFGARTAAELEPLTGPPGAGYPGQPAAPSRPAELLRVHG